MFKKLAKFQKKLSFSNIHLLICSLMNSFIQETCIKCLLGLSSIFGADGFYFGFSLREILSYRAILDNRQK